MSTELVPTSKHPWIGGFEDFHYEKDKEGLIGVITMFSLGKLLSEYYKDGDSEVNAGLLKKGPGIYRDDELRGNDATHCYTIILNYGHPKPGLAKFLFKKRLKELNKEYDEDFELVVTEDVEEVYTENFEELT